MPAPKELGTISTSYTAKASAWQVRQQSHPLFSSKNDQSVYQLGGTAPPFETFTYFCCLQS